MDDRAYKLHLEVQGTHWWFKARESIIISCLAPYMEGIRGGSFLDIGCGGGSFLHYLQNYGRIRAIDPKEDVLNYVQESFGKNSAIRGALPNEMPPFDHRFQLISALDVLEHIEDDAKSLRVISDLLETDGLFVLTVPAMPSLWSSHDVVSHHKRRYEKEELRLKLVQAGFAIEKLTHFNTFLFPPIFVYRSIRNLFPMEENNMTNEMSIGRGHWGKVLGAIFGTERFFLKRSNFPIGISLLAICRKVP